MGIHISTTKKHDDDNSPRCAVCRRYTGIQGINYCSRHKCGWPDCNGRKTDSMFETMCQKHTCADHMCHEPVVTNETSYCSKHKCGWNNCNTKAAQFTMFEPLCIQHKQMKT